MFVVLSAGLHSRLTALANSCDNVCRLVCCDIMSSILRSSSHGDLLFGITAHTARSETFSFRDLLLGELLFVIAAHHCFKIFSFSLQRHVISEIFSSSLRHIAVLQDLLLTEIFSLIGSLQNHLIATEVSCDNVCRVVAACHRIWRSSPPRDLLLSDVSTSIWLPWKSPATTSVAFHNMGCGWMAACQSWGHLHSPI